MLVPETFLKFRIKLTVKVLAALKKMSPDGSAGGVVSSVIEEPEALIGQEIESDWEEEMSHEDEDTAREDSVCHTLVSH